MNKTQKTYLGIIIATICFILLMRVWPYEFVQNPCENQYVAITEETESDYLSAGHAVSQPFVTQADYLKKIEIFMNVEQAGEADQIYALILDENREVIFEKTVSVKKVAKKGKLELKPDCQITNGVLYTVELYLEGNDDSNICVRLGNTETLGLLEYQLIGVLSQDAVTQESFVANYTYMAPCTPIRLAFYYVLIILGGIAAFVLITIVYRFLFAKSQMIRQTGLMAVKIIVSLLIFGMGIYSTLFAVVWKRFGGYIHDQVIYSLGIWIAVLFAGWMLWKDTLIKKQDVVERDALEKHPVTIIVNYLQVICFGLMFHAAVMYQNAAVMKEQNTNLEWICLLLGFAILVYQVEKTYFTGAKVIKGEATRKERIFFIAYVVVCALWIGYLVLQAVRFCGPLKLDEEAYALAVLTKWKEVVWGIIILHTIAFFRPRILKSLSIPMVIIWAFFAIWIWTHQYEYSYIKGIPVYFSLLLLQDCDRKAYTRILQNAINGMIFAFLLNMSYSLLHRPFHRMRFYRYQMYFHTVACTGELQIAAFAAVLSKLFTKYKNGSLKQAGWEICLLGIVQSYEVLSMTRTALLSTIGILICGLIAAWILYRYSVKQCLLRLGTVLLALIISFPTVYSATRMIPALVDDPYHFPIFMEEDFPDRIDQGMPLDDERYMDFIRFLYCMTTRFSLPGGIVNWIEDEYRDINYVPEARIDTMVANVGVSTDHIGIVPVLFDAEGEGNDLEEDVSNGRFDIWKIYMNDLNAEGHDDLSITLDDGEVIVHAHNSFIQMLHSFGYLGGIAFAVLVLTGIVKSCIWILMARKKETPSEDYAIYMTSLLVLLAYTVASLTEWLSTITIPLALLFWITCICLTRKHGEVA